MSASIIEIEAGKFGIKHYAEDGSSLGLSPETFATAEEAQAFLDGGVEVVSTPVEETPSLDPETATAPVDEVVEDQKKTEEESPLEAVSPDFGENSSTEEVVA